MTLRDHLLWIVYKYLAKNKWCRTTTALELDIAVRSVRNYINELRKKGYEIPDSKYHPVKKCQNCEYFMILDKYNRQWECYACKVLTKTSS
jgi:Mn-dependent DtxR family transcriptional regulator